MMALSGQLIERSAQRDFAPESDRPSGFDLRARGTGRQQSNRRRRRGLKPILVAFHR
jgi:hypothetical protein